MTGRTDLDRSIAAYLEERSTNRAPDGLLDAALAGVGRTRQRPAWIVPERWLATRVTNGAARLGNGVVVLAVIASVVALLIALGIVIGSRHRLPPPFGVAAPGVITVDLNGDIVTVNPDGTDVTRLTSGPETDDRPTFSPDGTLIAYESRLADGTTAVIVIGADGRHPARVADHLADAGNLVWAPDSRQVTFGGRVAGASDSRIYVVQADRPGLTELGGPDVYGEEPSWSPDGTKIAFKREFLCCGTTQYPDTLWLMNADGSDVHRLAMHRGSSNGFNEYANTVWSPDSKRVAFLAAGPSGPFDVYVVNVDGSDERDISNSAEEEYWPSWSPDGTKIAFPRMSATQINAGTMIVVNPDGSDPIQLTGAYVNSNTPVWSPDGKRLIGYVYNPTLDNNDAIAIFDPTGATPPVTIPINQYSSATWQRLAPP